MALTWEEFTARLRRMEKAYKKEQEDLPVVLKGVLLKAWLNNFKTESFFGKKWKQVQRRIPGTPTYKYIKPVTLRAYPILIGVNAMLQKAVLNSTVTCNKRMIAQVVNREHGIYHNEKGVRSKQGLIVRKFIGDHPDLRKQLNKVIRERRKKVLNTK